MRLRVVMVDDEPYSREMFTLSADLQQLEMELVACLENPLQLLDRLDEYRPDIVVTDIRMQEMDGLELIRRIRERYPDDIAFVLLSAYSQVEYARQAIQLGVRYYVVKPYLPAEINDVLRKLGSELRERRRQQAQDSEMDRNLLGRRILRLIDEQDWLGTDAAFPPGSLRYGIIGLFSGDAVTCIHDITLIHRELSEFPQVAIVLRQPMKVEFVMVAPGDPELEQLSDALRKKLDESRLSHDYYAAVGPSARRWAEVRDSWRVAGEISSQATWRRDHHWMRQPGAAAAGVPASRLTEIVRAMELGEKEKAECLICEQLQDEQAHLSSPGVLQLLADQLVYRSLSLNMVAGSDQLFDFYEAEMQHLDHLYVAKVQELLTAYSSRFISRLQAHQAEVRCQDDPVLLIRAYIDAHYSEPLTVQQIADALYFHPAYIGTLFKKSMGVSIHRYLHQVRISHAEEMMVHRNVKLTQIALDVGYNDYPSFITAFRQVRGVSPSSYRREEGTSEQAQTQPS